jgi:hypothetical protein
MMFSKRGVVSAGVIGIVVLVVFLFAVGFISNDSVLFSPSRGGLDTGTGGWGVCSCF